MGRRSLVKIKIFILAIIFSKAQSSCEALCVVPVADLLKKSAYEIFTEINSAKEAYKSLLMGDTKCKREYQILFNELVDILQIRDEEVQIRVPHIIYFDEEKNVYTNIYWTLKKNLICLDELVVRILDLNKVPEKISFNEDIKPDKSIVVLKEPFFAPDGRGFSAGTRFKMIAKNSSYIQSSRVSNETRCTEGYVSCYALSKNLQEIILEIPRDKLNFYEDKNINLRIKDFVKLLKSWANLDSGFIPYLYSGSSFIYAYHRDEILQRYSDNTFYRDELDVYPYTGFDCSCIISRATQICNLPYFYKDSITLERNLEQLNKFEELSEGDVIWFPGHVVIVSDLKNNLVIEARGYASGFGKVHECELGKLFKNINTFQDLFDARNRDEKLELLAKDGNLRYVIEEFKILSLKSGLYKEFKSLYNPVSKLDTSKCFKVF